MTTQLLAAGGYRYIPAVSQYSAGVVAEPGFRIERARFSRVVPMREGFELIEQTLAAAGRPNAAFCACELRSPEPFTEQGFRDFNAVYVEPLRRWGLLDGTTNPVARSNVCPLIDPPSEPGFFAFSYTVPDAKAHESFIVAGSGEAPEGLGSYSEHTIARGDVSTEGLRTKARWVLGEMENRMRALGMGWAQATAAQVYTVHDFHSFVGDELVRRGAMNGGITWHLNRPPVRELEFEMDCRGVSLERVLWV